MSKIDKIYNLFSNEGYRDSTEKQRTEKELYGYLENSGLEEKDFEEYLNSFSSEVMRQGFKYGFRYAMELFVEKEGVMA